MICIDGWSVTSVLAGLFLGWWLYDVVKAWKDRRFMVKLLRGDYDEALKYWTRDEKDWSWKNEKMRH